MSELERLRDIATEAARTGGAIVREHFGGARDIRAKAPGDWVSAVDVSSEHAIRAVLDRLAPGIAFVGEETGGDHGGDGWYVDPLDGTANFLHGFFAVGVSIGLVRDGKPVVGVVDAPLLGRTYSATLGGGAWCDGRRLQVSDRPLEQAICATGLPFRHKDLEARYLEVFRTVFHNIEDLRRVGGASLDLSWTGEGVFDGYFEMRLGSWDVAAGAVIVREAGGVVTDWAGDPDAWLWSGDICAAPPQTHGRLLDLIGDRAK